MRGKLVWKNYSDPVLGRNRIARRVFGASCGSRNADEEEGLKDRGKSCVAAWNRKFDSHDGVASCRRTVTLRAAVEILETSREIT